MSIYRCDCGDSECPSCGTAQGTRSDDQDLEFAQFTDEDKDERYHFDNMCICGNPYQFCTCYL